MECLRLQSEASLLTCGIVILFFSSRAWLSNRPCDDHGCSTRLLSLIIDRPVHGSFGGVRWSEYLINPRPWTLLSSNGGAQQSGVKTWDPVPPFLGAPLWPLIHQESVWSASRSAEDVAKCSIFSSMSLRAA